MGLGAVTLFSPVLLLHVLNNGNVAVAQNAWPGPRPGGTLACAAGAQPCPTHPGHTWCPEIPDPEQCEKPPVACPPPRQLPFCNTSLGFRERAVDLVSRIPNTSVKIGLLSTTSDGVPSLGIGSFEWCELYCHSSACFGDSCASLQLIAPVRQSAGSEGLHGIRCGHGVDCGGNGSTVFPQTIGQAAAFNRSLWRAVGDAISTEFRAFSNQGHGFLSVFAPNINVRASTRVACFRSICQPYISCLQIFREARWGRGQEVHHSLSQCVSVPLTVTKTSTVH